jgi:signal transduction histidine kinase
LDAQYFEFVSASEYERTLTVLATVLLVAASVTTVGGAASGWFISRRVLRPLTSVASSARSIAEGNLAHRLDVGEDPDLTGVATAFNEMADAVQTRVEREHRFTADVSHELRTPLTALGAAVSLAKRSELTERSRYAMTILDEQLQHFTRLTIELLEISRIDSGVERLHLDDVDIEALIAHVLDQADVDRSLLTIAPGTPDTWRLDGTRLERIVANLIENAAKYAGGTTAVSVSVVADELTIEVDDAGPGVPDHDRQAIFGRFNRGSMGQPDDQLKGTGLGLALVDEHARMHGGHALVTSNDRGGARFVVTIPRQGS